MNRSPIRFALTSSTAKILTGFALGLLLMSPLQVTTSADGAGFVLGYADAHAAKDNDRSSRGGRSGRKGGNSGRRGNDRNESGRSGASNNNNSAGRSSQSSSSSRGDRPGSNSNAGTANSASPASAAETADVGNSSAGRESGDAEGGDRMRNPWYDLDLDGMRTFNAHGVSQISDAREEVLCSEFDCDWPR